MVGDCVAGTVADIGGFKLIITNIFIVEGGLLVTNDSRFERMRLIRNQVRQLLKLKIRLILLTYSDIIFVWVK